MLMPGPVYVGRGSYVKPTLYSGQGCARLGPATGGAGPPTAGLLTFPAGGG